MDFNENWKRCPRNHWYDPSKTSVCPQCAEEDRLAAASAGSAEDYGATEPISAGSIGGFGETAPGGSFQGVPDFGQAVGFTGRGGIPDFGGSDPGLTMPPQNGSGFTHPAGDTAFRMEDYGTTEPVYENQVHGFLPVVGWLVCIDGPDRGRDYRIRAGYNSIGRASHMDICITGDLKISREKHAMVAFDPDEKLFFFGPVDGKSLVKLNGKLVMSPNELHAYDTLTIGSSKLIFIPLCGDHFSWETTNA